MVGGPRHGQEMEIPDGRPSVIIPEPMPLPIYYSLEDPRFYDPRIRTCEYVRRDVGTDRIVYIAVRSH